MTYKSIIDFRNKFINFPRKVIDSLDLLYFKLNYLFKYDFWDFAINNLIKEKCRYINKDLVLSLPSFIKPQGLNIINIEVNNFISNPCSIIMDYLGVSFFKYLSCIEIESRYTDIEETGFNDFIEI